MEIRRRNRRQSKSHRVPNVGVDVPDDPNPNIFSIDKKKLKGVDNN